MIKILMKDKNIMILLIIVGLSVIIPLTSKYDYYTNNLNEVNMKMSINHMLGTDHLGRDYLHRLCTGVECSLIISGIVTFISIILGVMYGGISGYYLGLVDRVLMRIIDGISSIPIMVYVIIVSANMSKNNIGIINVVISMSMFCWLNTARMIRNKIIELKDEEIVLEVLSFGATDFQIFKMVLLPECKDCICICVLMTITESILMESAISVLGFGIKPPRASLGTLVNEGMKLSGVVSIQGLLPIVIICLILLMLNNLKTKM